MISVCITEVQKTGKIKILRLFLKKIRQNLLKLIILVNVKYVYGVKKVHYHKNEFIVLCLVKNGEYYIKTFIQYYFSLGAKHIVFLDNNSKDKTVEIAEDNDNITILHTKLSFKIYEFLLRNYLIKKYCKNRWSLCVDIDEFFDFPHSGKITMKRLLEYLNNHNYTAVTSYMLDMFSYKGINRLKKTKKKFNKNDYHYYDISDIEKYDYHDYCKENNIRNNNLSNDKIKYYHGGIRKRLFNANVCITKHPLLFYNQSTKRYNDSAHHILNGQIADISSVLYHYLFIDGFYQKADTIVREGNYPNNSIEYKQYLRVLKKNTKLNILQNTSKYFYNTEDLIENKFLAISNQYLNYIDNLQLKKSILNRVK